MTAEPFAEEMRVFQAHRDEWVRSNPGQFVVIQDTTVADGFYESYAEALRAGIRHFGVRRSFLVRQVWATEPVYVVS